MKKIFELIDHTIKKNITIAKKDAETMINQLNEMKKFDPYKLKNMEKLKDDFQLIEGNIDAVDKI